MQALASGSLATASLFLALQGFVSTALVTFGVGGLAAAAAVRTWRDERLARRSHAAPDALKDFHRAQAMLDLVGPAILTLHASGRVIPENRSARRLFGEGAASLCRIPDVGAEAAQRIEALPLGGREIVRLANGTFVLVRTVRFKTATAEPVRLLSLQRLDDDLQAVEVKAWKDLAAVLAHEIMNSLTPISSMSQRLRTLVQEPGKLTPAATVEMARIADVIARRSVGLTSFVTAYRRITELPQPDLETIPLVPLLDHVVSLADRPTTPRAVIKQDVPDGLEVTADRALLEQALLNLLSNALEATAGTASPTVHIGARAQADELVLSVADNGPGIPPDAQDRLFVPFFTTKPHGTGLGLAIVRQVALAHGGRVQSGPGLQHSGLTVNLILPRRTPSRR